jgi:hypothetical protein
VPVTGVPPKLSVVATTLLERAARSGSKEISLDAIGEAIGVVPVSTEDVDALMAVLEGAGLRVAGPEGQRGVQNLQRIIPAARALAGRLGRAATLAELAAETGLAEEDVRHALALGSVMGR